VAGAVWSAVDRWCWPLRSTIIFWAEVCMWEC